MAKWIYNGVEFKAGDKVRVVKAWQQGDSGGMGSAEWENTWNEDMDAAIGVVHVIESISRCGVRFIGNWYSFPLSSLERVYNMTLPSGEFKLVGKDGVVYSVQKSLFEAGFCIDWEFPVNNSGQFTTVSIEELVAAIESGFWYVQKTEEQLAKEAELTVYKQRLGVLINETTTINNQIAELEKELTQ